MVAFQPLDWFWVGAYTVLTIFLGLSFYFLGKKSAEEFFIAGRGLPWWLPSTSVYATHTATDTPIWMMGSIYRYGVAGIWLGFFTAWAAISAFVSTKIFRRSLAYTHAEYQALRFGGLGGELLRGWFAGWQIFIQMFILGWVGIAMGRVANLAFGWDEWVGLVLFGLVGAIYTIAAGYWGAIIADVQQGFVAFVVIVLVSVWGAQAAGGVDGIRERLAASGQEWKLDPFAFTGLFTGDFSVFWFFTILFVAIIGGLGMGSSIDWYTEAQRIQSAKTVRDASWAMWSGTLLILVRNSIWAVAMLAFVALFPTLDLGDPAQARTAELGWYHIGFETFPVGLVGFFFAAILAIHLSTISSSMNLGALYWTRDIYHHYIKPEATDHQLVRMGRIATGVMLLGSFVYGSIIGNITEWLIFALWIMVAGVWLPNILQVVWWRVNAWGYLVTWIANLGVSWIFVWILPALDVIPSFHESYQFWILLAISALIFIPVTLLTPPESMDRLVDFYDAARPVGWWRPVRREWERRQVTASSPAQAAKGKTVGAKA
ncbi:MAG TPA: sodium:solute symporter [Candidatus Thermoplasmatota archaeon]|nr:sodium:solute symporter [Candidatus Thermoplasmatota archaeon]